MKRITTPIRMVVMAALMLLLPLVASAGSGDTRTPARTTKAGVSESSAAKKKMTRLRHSRARRRRVRERFFTSSIAENNTVGDVTTGEDPIVRRAAVEALGNLNGTVVAIDPGSGRILAMANQKLALSEGAPPCSTIKLPVALAALSENVITRDTLIRLGRRSEINLTEALAVSNNAFFEALGRKLGFEKVAYYAHQFGLGELAGWGVEGEHLGEYPSEALDAKLGGVGKMCSYGDSISMTPLQLGAMVAAIANGGTLYYLQHPRTAEQAANFRSIVKRQLAIAPLIPDVAEGMAGSVSYGTGRTVHYNFNEEQIMGKTGTCSKDGTRFGWFASYANTRYGRIVVVVFLRGDRAVAGPKAAEIAGKMYRGLYDKSFFAATYPGMRATSAAGANQ